MISCLGGWCAVRDRCKHHQAQDRSTPVERLCEPKQRDAFEPIDFRQKTKPDLPSFDFVPPELWKPVIHRIADKEVA